MLDSTLSRLPFASTYTFSYPLFADKDIIKAFYKFFTAINRSGSPVVTLRDCYILNAMDIRGLYKD